MLWEVEATCLEWLLGLFLVHTLATTSPTARMAHPMPWVLVCMRIMGVHLSTQVGKVQTKRNSVEVRVLLLLVAFCILS